jgi:hypothetical protein
MLWELGHISKSAAHGAYIATKVVTEGVKLAVIIPLTVAAKVIEASFEVVKGGK